MGGSFENLFNECKNTKNVNYFGFLKNEKIIEQLKKNQVLLPLFFDGMGNGHRIGIFVNAGNYYC